MLPEKFRNEPAFGTNSGVRLVRLLDGYPLMYGIGVSPSLVDMEAFVAPDGNVVEAHYAERSFRPLLELPIRSATEAWQVFLNKAAPVGYRYVVNPPEKANDYRIWQRSYPTGERIDLYGYPWILQPLNPGEPAVSFLGNWHVTGEQAAAFAAQASPYDFLHAWGQINPDGQGRLTFQIEGWEVSPYEDLLPSGKIERQGEQVYLVTDQGRYQLLDAPAALEDGMSANARGVSPDGETFDWSTIDNNQYLDGGYGMLDACAGGGGGGGGDSMGGGSFLIYSRRVTASQRSPHPRRSFLPAHSSRVRTSKPPRGLSWHTSISTKMGPRRLKSTCAAILGTITADSGNTGRFEWIARNWRASPNFMNYRCRSGERSTVSMVADIRSSSSNATKRSTPDWPRNLARDMASGHARG